jgi:hypothetical protein
MPDFRIVRFLGSAFTPDFNISNSLKIANTAVEILGDKLDGPPSIMPIPQDAPSEIPRIMLSSSDKKLNVNISLSRTNLFSEMPPPIDSEEIDINEYSSTSSLFFSEFQKRLDLRVQRMGFVTERVKFRKDALSYILERFCNKDQIEKGRPFNNAKRFEIHSLKKYTWHALNINSWVRVKYLSILMKNRSHIEPVLLVENDLNTLSMDEDPGASFTDIDIKNFFDKAHGHIEEILNLYFA